MTWRELVSSVPRENDATGFSFFSPASSALLEEVEQALAIRLPSDLRSLLMETDGIDLQMHINGEWISYQALVWSSQEILANNRRFRDDQRFNQINRPVDTLLLFSEVGNGDLFAFPVEKGEAQGSSVLVWNHEDDSLRAVASSLQDFLES